MKTPILITGFMRSGTTLMRRIVSMHPDLEYDLLHEQRRLLQFKSKEDALVNYHMPVTQAGKVLGSTAHIKSGEKVPFYNNADLICDYIDRWVEWFPEGMIIYVDRNKFDCANSCEKTFGYDRIKTHEYYDKNTGIVKDKLNATGIDYYISYSDIVHFTRQTVDELYDYIWGHDNFHIDKVISNKDPWIDSKGRTMCGLRYKDGIY